jgi:pimeloyl-ACP methyl ester carboxylesterase
MPSIDIPQGTLHYRVAGPEDGGAAPVVFVHGLLVNSELWSATAAALAAHGVRSYALDLPLGSHEIAFGDDADLSPRGVARMIADALAALDLHDVTLVGNDTGGALCQFVIDSDHSRVGRLVLTNCDAFDKFPPPPFGALVALGRSPRRLRVAMRSMRPKALRHSMLGYGGLAAKPLDPDLTLRWTRPLVADRAVARDAARFMRAVDPKDLLDVSTRLDRFDKPVLLVWGAADRFFKLSFAERLRDTFPNAQLVPVAGARTFVALDEPEVLAERIAQFSRDEYPLHHTRAW